MSAYELKVLHLPEEYALIEISAIMAYPSQADEEKRHGLALRMLLKLAAAREDSPPKEYAERAPEFSQLLGSTLGGLSVLHGGWSKLSEVSAGPGQKKGVEDELWDRYQRGLAIGEVLKFALFWGLSFRGAAKQYCSDDAIQRLKKTGRPQYYDPKSIANFWPFFQPAAHLWAALVDGERKTDPVDQYFYDITGLSGMALTTFIDWAEGYRQEAARRMPPRGPRRPIIDLNESWIIT